MRTTIAIIVAVVGAGTIWWGVMDHHCTWVSHDVQTCAGTLAGLVATAVGGVMVGAGVALAAVDVTGRRRP